MINWTQIYQLAKVNNCDINLFLTQHLRKEKDDGHILEDIKLPIIQYDNSLYIESSLLYNWKKIYVCLLTNLNIQVGMVIETQTIVFGLFQILKIMPNYPSQNILITAMGFYTKLNNNTVLNSHSFIYI